MDGRLIDIDCDTDKLEVCLTDVLGCAKDGGSCGKDNQAKLVNFLACFEGQNHANMTFAAPCAAQTGVEWSSVQACYADEQKRNVLWKAHLDNPARAALEHFPTVLVNGASWSIYNDTVAEFRAMICNAWTGSPPAGCTGDGLTV